MLEDNIMVAYVNDDYHNLLYDHIGGHARLDLEIFDLVIGDEVLMVHNGICFISVCEECSNYKVKVVNRELFLLTYASDRVNNVTFNNAVVFVSADGELGNFRLSEDTILQVDSGAMLYGKMNFAGNVSAAAGTKVRLDVDSLTPSAPGSVHYLINDLSYIEDAFFFLVDSSAVETGDYYIAPDSTASIDAITIKNTSGELVGILSEEQDVFVRDVKYSLSGSIITVSEASGLELSGSSLGLAFQNIEGEVFYVEYSTDSFSSALQITVETRCVDSYNMPGGNYQWQVSGDQGSSWHEGGSFTAESASAPQRYVSDADGDMDIFFAEADGTWDAGYAAEHQGIRNGWSGTGEKVILIGKNRFADAYSGSGDANILILTDDGRGDALFLDDVFTSLGEQARLLQIREIRAGFGDDLIDMTSCQFDYEGSGIKIFAGSGNDTVWAGTGNNILCGGTGSDRLVGGSGNDIIAGGRDDDRMHGGGGEDIFTFCGNWGKDIVEQLAGGKVTLWFKEGVVSCWDAESLTYSDGINSVEVSGVAAENITLKFGDDGSALFDSLAGADLFEEAVIEKIYEDNPQGILV